MKNQLYIQYPLYRKKLTHKKIDPNQMIQGKTKQSPTSFPVQTKNNKENKVEK